jgi:hypothetical protein
VILSPYLLPLLLPISLSRDLFRLVIHLEEVRSVSQLFLHTLLINNNMEEDIINININELCTIITINLGITLNSSNNEDLVI